MNNAMKLTLFALALGGLAIAAVPAASAAQCYTNNPALSYVVETCNYVLSGEAHREAHETAEFLWEQYGDQLP